MSVFENIDRDMNPFAVYEKMRQTNPVYFDPKNQHWNIFRYEDVQRVLSDYNSFSSQFAGDANDPNQPFAASMISSDPPRHRELRSLVTQVFTPRAVEALAPRIQQIVDEHLDRVRGTGRLEVINDLAYPLPVIVIAELLGIPSEDREKFKEWSDIIVGLSNMAGEFDAASFENRGGAIFEMAAYFFNMIEQRRQQPGDDLISGLIRAEVDGRKLETIELLGFCSLLLVAGNETTTNLIGNSLLTFGEQPDLWQQLRKDSNLIPSAIEEVLRYRSPVQSMFRVAKAGAEVAGQVLPEGARLVAWIGSANHDVTQFPDPDQFVVNRTPNRHIAFGQGIHYCLGAPLARLEAKIALTEMVNRYKEICLAPNASLERLPSTLVFGLKQVPLLVEET